MALLPYTAIAYGAFVANFLFGIGVKTGVVPRGRYRRLHHVLYAVVMASVITAGIAALLRGDASWYRLAAMAMILAVLPRFRGTDRGHWIYATFAFVVYTLVVVGN